MYILKCSSHKNRECICWISWVCVQYNLPKLMTINVTKSDWTLQEYDLSKIESFYKRIIHWYNTKCPFKDLQENLENKLVEWISTKDITKMIEKSAIDLISIQNPEWQLVAWRMKMRSLYKRASKNLWITNWDIYTPEYLLWLIKEYSSRWLYHKTILEKYTEEEILNIGKMLNQKFDDEYWYTTVQMYERRYLLNRDWIIRELPQHMYLIIAMFLMINEKEERNKHIQDLYTAIATGKISLPTPNLLNARTPNSQLSSCFILDVDDDLRGIYHSIENMAQISKNWWGIWVYLWNIRAKSSMIKWVYWLSWWVMPWTKVINDTWIAVNQMGKRSWAISVTLDVFHADIFRWLDMQTETWDIRSKAFDVFPSVSFPDIFFKRLEEDWDFNLFCPYETEKITWVRLQDLWWDDFEEAYIKLETDDRLKLKSTHKAKDIFKAFLKTTVETGMPYTFFRDTVNRLNPNKHAWMVHCTNLCTEIAQNQSRWIFKEEVRTKDWNVTIEYIPWDTVICNLASINVAKVNTKEESNHIHRIVTRTLDNVIDLNEYPVEETRISAEKYRAIGIGYMWVAEYLATNKINYWSKESVEIIDKLFQMYAYDTLESSMLLAKERWPYPAFEWSDFSKGIAYWRKIGDLSEWDENSMFHLLENAVTRYWVRFWYHSAPAPNTSTALVVWTTAWVVPIYKKYFVETNAIAPVVNVAPWINPDNMWFYTEYANMKMDWVIDLVSTIQKRIDQSVSCEWMINPNNTSPAELYGYFLKAWKQWIKTIYYVRSLSLDVAEACESCSW